jgi:hypothetical protein
VAIRERTFGRDLRINPNFNFAQGVLGETAGRSYGIIEAVIESIGLVGPSGSLNSDDVTSLRGWFISGNVNDAVRYLCIPEKRLKAQMAPKAIYRESWRVPDRSITRL